MGTTPERPAPRVEVGPLPERTAPPGGSVPGLNPVRSFDEVRAVWVVRFTMTSERAVRTMVEEAAAAGINTLIVQVRGRGDAYYASDIEPRGEPIRDAEPFDPLALTIAEAHARGMAVHAWVNTHLVWGPAALPESREHIVRAHPDWLAVPRVLARELAAVDPFDQRFTAQLVEHALENSSTVEGLFTSPSHPLVNDRVRAVWLDLARRYDVDGIHFDYVRFPSAQYDYSVGTLERFRAWVASRLTPERFAELDDANADDLFAFVDAEPDLWASYRRDSVTRLVRRVQEDMKAVRPRMVVSAAVIADPELAFNDRFQDWRSWLRDGLIDVAVPMAYTQDRERFGSLVRAARAAAPARERVWAGIGAYLNTPGATVGMIDLARAEGAGGVVLFSYDWVAGEGRGDPDDPLLERIGRERFGRR